MGGGWEGRLEGGVQVGRFRVVGWRAEGGGAQAPPTSPCPQSKGGGGVVYHNGGDVPPVTCTPRMPLKETHDRAGARDKEFLSSLRCWGVCP